MNDLVRFLSVYTQQKEKCDTILKFLSYLILLQRPLQRICRSGLIDWFDTASRIQSSSTLVIEHPILCTGRGDLGHREGRADIVVAAVGIVNNDPAG